MAIKSNRLIPFGEVIDVFVMGEAENGCSPPLPRINDEDETNAAVRSSGDGEVAASDGPSTIHAGAGADCCRVAAPVGGDGAGETGSVEGVRLAGAPKTAAGLDGRLPGLATAGTDGAVV